MRRRRGREARRRIGREGAWATRRRAGTTQGEETHGASSSGEVATQGQPVEAEAYATRMARQKREMEEEEEREFQRRRQQEYEDCVADANAKWEECQAMVTNLMGGRALGPGVGG